MPIITKETERQKILVYLLVIIVVAIVLVLVYGFSWRLPKMNPMSFREVAEPIGATPTEEEINEIDFSILESPFLKELQSFEEIEPFKEKIGRENPFIPY